MCTRACDCVCVYALLRVRESAWEFLLSPFRGVASCTAPLAEASWRGRACASLLSPRRLFGLLTSRVYPHHPTPPTPPAAAAPPPPLLYQHPLTHTNPPPAPSQKTNSGSKHATTAARYPPILPQSHRRRSSRLPPSERARRLHRVMPLLQQEKHPATAHTVDACRRTRHHNLGP